MLYLLFLIPVILILIILIRTFKFKSIFINEELKNHDIDENRAYESLSKMLTFKTVSNANMEIVKKGEFLSFQNYLKERYPLIHEKAVLKNFDMGLLYFIKGESSENPTVFMSHYDVVPAEGEWKKDPFSGEITKTHIYGRGALDTKSSLNAIMEAVEFSLQNKKTFKNDLYLTFGSDEEVYGISQQKMIAYFKENNIKPKLVLDEGGAIVSNIFPGIKEKAAVIGIAEKGFMNVSLIAKSAGGHASTPKKDTPITDLAKAINKLNWHKDFKLKLTPPVKALFDNIAPYSSSFAIRMIFSNLWLFMPVVKLIANKSGGEFLALFKTTQAFTLATGSKAINVLPAVAEIGINYRLRPGEKSADIIKRIKDIIKNDNIDVVLHSFSEPSTTSKLDDSYNIVEEAIKKTWENVIPTPYLMVATTDSRHYHEISENVYKFSPMDVSKNDLAKIHGLDEDISLENVKNGVKFYLNLIDQL